MKWRILAVLSVGLLAVTAVRADDLTTLSGTTYRHVIPVRAEPDGVTWRHGGGMVKIDFADCPEPVRRAYQYDAVLAAAYRETQAAARLQADEQARKLVRAHEEHQRARLQLNLQNTADAAPVVDGTTFTLRRRLDTESAAAAALDEQAHAKKAARDLLTKDDGTLWDRRLWAIPCMITGGYHPGVAFEPGANLNPHEFRASLHHAPGAFAPYCTQDKFFTPAYMTRSYYEDTDRAAAFARGEPLPPR